jgi:hypothetical protein
MNRTFNVSYDENTETILVDRKIKTTKGNVAEHDILFWIIDWFELYYIYIIIEST